MRNNVTIKPIRDSVVIKRDDNREENIGKLKVVTKHNDHSLVRRGTVLSIGSDIKNKFLRVGDNVWFLNNLDESALIKSGIDNILIMKEEKILAVIK